MQTGTSITDRQAHLAADDPFYVLSSGGSRTNRKEYNRKREYVKKASHAYPPEGGVWMLPRKSNILKILCQSKNSQSL